jgi:hypothetical protein
MQKNMASGPFADLIDVWCAFALHTQKHTHSNNLHHPYFNDFNDLLHFFLQNHTSPSIQNAFSANYFVAFHKDPDDLKCICPLGISTTLCCLAGSLLMTIFHNEIIQYLLPDNQFSIAVPGGTYFVIPSTQSPIDQFFSKPSNYTCVILLLDLINMFNQVSCEACHKFSHLPHPSPPSFDTFIFSILIATHVGYQLLPKNGFTSLKMKLLHKAIPLVPFSQPLPFPNYKTNKCSPSQMLPILPP